MKRLLIIVKEQSSYETTEFLHEPENRIGFRINTVQTDNGGEFKTGKEMTDRPVLFEMATVSLGMELRHTRPYSPWQNGKVRRSHRECENIIILDFKIPNQIVAEYFSE